MPPRDPLKPTFKQAQFAKAYVKNKGKGVEAALAVYETENRESAKTIAKENLQKPAVQIAIRQILEQNGLSLDNLGEMSAKALKGALDAKPNFASGISHLEFLYKLHGASPINKSMNMTVNASDRLNVKKFDEIAKSLESLASSAKAIIDDLQK